MKWPTRETDAAREARVRGVQHNSSRPAPGGPDGAVVDYTRWYPPDTPFGWGQNFPAPFTNIPGINGGQWRNQFLPSSFWTPDPLWLWPNVYGSDGSYQTQLMGGTPAKPLTAQNAQTMHAMTSAQSRVSGPDITGIAGAFSRSEVM